MLSYKDVEEFSEWDGKQTELQRDELWKKKFSGKPLTVTGKLSYLDALSETKFFVGVSFEDDTSDMKSITGEVLGVRSELLALNRGDAVEITGNLPAENPNYESVVLQNAKLRKLGSSSSGGCLVASIFILAAPLLVSYVGTKF